MSQIQKKIEIEAPVSEAYNQWTQFEDFPQFMEGVHEVRQIDDSHLYWRAKVGGQEKEWQAEITEQIPDVRIAWKSLAGTENSGVVDFHRLSDDRCEVQLSMKVEPEGALEAAGDWLGVLGRRVQGDLERFKELMNQRKVASGGWRGSI